MGLLADDGLPAEDENFLPVNVVHGSLPSTPQGGGAEDLSGSINVNELGSELGGSDDTSFLPAMDRVNLASDALGPE